MSMFIFVTIFMVGVLIFALVYTISIGKSQKSTQNKQYEQNRVKNLIILTLIYLLTVIGAMYLLYDYVSES